jgi:hypothetical protein
VGGEWVRRSGESELDVLDQVADVLEADGQPKDAVSDADHHERAGLQTTETGPLTIGL